MTGMDGGSKSLGSRKGHGVGTVVSTMRRKGGGGGGLGESVTNRALTALMVAAFALSLMTVFLSSPSISRSLGSFDGSVVFGGGMGGGGGGKEGGARQLN